jgi:hypothetical protein
MSKLQTGFLRCRIQNNSISKQTTNSGQSFISRSMSTAYSLFPQVFQAAGRDFRAIINCVFLNSERLSNIAVDPVLLQNLVAPLIERVF